MNKNIAGILIGIVAIFWGLSFVAISQVLEYLQPVQVLALRWTLSAIVFGIFILAGKIKFNFKKGTVKFLLLTGLCEPCFYSIFETYGIKYTSASLSAIFIATIPTVTLLVSLIIFKKNPGKLGIAGIALAFIGVLISTCFVPGFSIGGHILGYVVMSCAVFVGMVYGFISKKAGETYDASAITAIMAFMGTITFNIICLIKGDYMQMYVTFFQNPKLILLIAFLGICCSSICYMSFNHLLKLFDVSSASNVVSAAITVVGVLGGILINHDPAGIATIVGMVITIAGVWLSYKSMDEVEG